MNIELAAPDQFIPALDGWRERSILIGRTGLFDPRRLRELFESIEPRLERYPGLDPDAFRAKVDEAVARLTCTPGGDR